MVNPAELSVRQIMTPDPITVEPERPLQDVLCLMTQRRIGAVLVVSDDRLVGIFTERDFLRNVAESPPGWRKKPVGDWMTCDLHEIAPDTGWENAVAMMERFSVRHLPVVEHGKVIGIVSSRGLMAWRTEHLNRLVEERTAELQRLYDLVSARDAEMRQNMVIAGRLQARLLLPKAPPGWPELSWGIHYTPLDPLGGDYYDFATAEDRYLGILIADAAGHSIAAAMVAIMARFAFAEIVRHSVRPAEVLGFMNRRLQGLTDERFVTAFYGVLDRKTREFRYANAGHPYPLRFNPDRVGIEELSAKGLMLGIIPEARYEERSITLQAGDRLCFYTDGLTDCRDAANEPYGTERLVAFLEQNGALSAQEMVNQLADHLKGFRSDRPAWDDLTVMVTEIATVPEPPANHTRGPAARTASGA
jgi:serine phosphatase RsbU (regulator of sigma subunit)